MEVLELKKIITNNAPKAIGPYSQGIVAGDFLFVSGQIPISPENGNVIGNDIKTQAEQVMKNLSSIANAAGLSLDNTVKTTCFLTDMNNFSDFNEVYSEYFSQKPARSCVAVKDLPRGVLCEVEAIISIN